MIITSVADTDIAMVPDCAAIFGVGASAITLFGVVSMIKHRIRRRTTNYVCIVGAAHGLILTRRDPLLDRVHVPA